MAYLSCWARRKHIHFPLYQKLHQHVFHLPVSLSFIYNYMYIGLWNKTRTSNSHYFFRRNASRCLALKLHYLLQNNCRLWSCIIIPWMWKSTQLVVSSSTFFISIQWRRVLRCFGCAQTFLFFRKFGTSVMLGLLETTFYLPLCYVLFLFLYAPLPWVCSSIDVFRDIFVSNLFVEEYCYGYKTLLQKLTYKNDVLECS